MESDFICDDQNDFPQVSTYGLVFSGRACRVPLWLAIDSTFRDLRVGPRIAYPSSVAQYNETFVTTEKRKEQYVY